MGSTTLKSPAAMPRASHGAALSGERSASATRWLVVSLVLLFAIGLSALVWTLLRFEAAERQRDLERDVADVAQQIRGRLLRDGQSLMLAGGDPRNAGNAYAAARRAAELLAERPEIVLVEWRDAAGQLRELHVSPLSRPAGKVLSQTPLSHEAAVARAAAVATAIVPVPAQPVAGVRSRGAGPIFSTAYFVPLPDFGGIEVIDLWVPLEAGIGQDTLRAVYGLPALLAEQVPGGFAGGHDLSLTEVDGTQLARRSQGGRGQGVYRARALIDLPGATYVLRADSVRAGPRLIPNLLTSLVVALAVALFAALARLVRDVRRRARAEAALLDAYAFRKAMEDSLVTGLRARDLDGRITYVNPAFCDMVGLPAAELVGHGPPMPYWAPEAIDEYRHRHAQVLAGTVTAQGYESAWMRRDGERFPVLIHEAPLIDADGRHAGWMASVVDLADRRRTEEINRQQQEKLQQAARLATMGELATVLSHELNQPLAAISSYATGAANLVDAAPANPPGSGPLQGELREALSRIAAQAQRAGRIIRRVNDFMRRRAPSREPVDVGEMVATLQPLIELQARKTSAHVRLSVHSGGAAAMADRVMLEQLVLNLTRNAIESMASVRRDARVLEVEVSQADDGSAVRLTVSDRGSGIAPDVAERLFTPFFSTKADGLGLGLSICRSVAEQCGGRLWHEARDGGGTRFVLSLPLGTAP